MSRIGTFAGAAIIAALCGQGPWARAAELMSRSDADRLDLQAQWELKLPLEPGEAVARTVLLDDNLYVLTTRNNAMAVHAPTGILRWITEVAREGQAVRGPTHSTRYVFFTTPGAVRVLDRRTGEPAVEPRALRGVIIAVAHDTATISIGEAHGVRPDAVFAVQAANQESETAPPIATFKATSVQQKASTGYLTRRESLRGVQPGDRVWADIEAPLEQVKLPFAASSPAVADDACIYVGAANQRFYALNILRGVEIWAVYTARTVTSSPVLVGDNLYFADLDGMVVSCSKHDKIGNWTFRTEGPVFADLLVQAGKVYVASSDRSLYCLDRATGKRLWRQRFDTPLLDAPAWSNNRLYQNVEGEGLLAISATTGKRSWRRDGSAQFLLELDGAAMLFSASDHRLTRLDAKTGRATDGADVRQVDFACASAVDGLMALVSRSGEVVGLRSRHAPPLRPAQLAEVLRNDARAKRWAGIDASRRAEAGPPRALPAPTRPRPQPLVFEDDWLDSRSRAEPVGGSRGQRAAPAKAMAAKKTAPAEAEDKGEAEEAGGEEGAESETTTSQPAEEKGAQEGDEDEGAAASQPAGKDEQEGGEEGGATTRPSDDEGGDEG